MTKSIFEFVLCAFLVGHAVAEENHDILLNGTTSIQLKLFDNAIQFFRSQSVKNFNYEVQWQNFDTQVWSSKGVLYSRLVPDESKYVSQSNQGLEYNETEMVTFALNTTTPLTTSLSIIIRQNITLRGFIEPFKSFETSGYRNISLLDQHWNVVGEVKVSYLIIRPITRFNPLVEKYSNTDEAVFMGHRGTGVGRRTDLPEQYLENTIAAFNFACSKGADMIELDVQLSSDKIPIINHDFYAKSFLHDRNGNSGNVSFEIPLKDLSYSDFQKISTKYVPHIRTGIDTVENQPFEKFEDVLKKLNPKCGINVEIKYPQLYENLEWDGVPGLELNEYVDRILEVLYAHGGDRKMVITSFHPDLCSMVQLKQNKYRVGLLTSGAVKTWFPFTLYVYDPRTTSVELGTAFATSAHLKGLSLMVDDVIAHPGHVDYVRMRNLTLYVWGGKLDTTERIEELKKAGVNALIFDKLDLIIPKNHK